jgi:toxin ParE1/3/4
MKIEWTKLALADLKHIYAYICKDSERSAKAVLSAVRNAIHGQLEVSPLSGRTGRVSGTRELIVPRLPYIVTYRIKDTNIQILRVLHNAQRYPNSL